MPSKRSEATGDVQGAGPASASATASGRTRADTQSGSMMDDAKDKVRELADRAQDEASEKARSGARRGKDRAADALGAVAQSLRSSSQQLREEDRDTVGGFVEKAANRVQSWADYVQNTDPGEMADRVESFARREPAIFLGGAFTLGLLGARFLKSSRKGEQGQGNRASRRSSTAAASQQFSRPGAVLSDREVPISRTPY